MQNRGLVKFFAILFALVSVYQLSFTFVSQGIEKDAKEFAKGNPEKEVKLSKITVTVAEATDKAFADQFIQSTIGIKLA